MSLDFPNSPTIGQIFGIYSWDGEKWAPASSATNGVTSFNTRAGAVTLTTSDVTAVLPGSSTTPGMDGSATAGVGTAWARGDHIHPTDTSRYAASNPAGYVTAASLGTMSTQNATAVAITGGAINNTSVGATTRSSGAFTTLAANAAATFTSSLTASPLNANIVFSPTGSGVVTINPSALGTINNMSVGATVASTGAFTNLTASGTVSGSGFTTLLAPYATTASLGTISTQNANAVAITGGAINGTTVGATTPSTGAFTTLTAATSVTLSPSGAVTINPSTVGSINNVAIGSATQSSGSFTTLSASGNVAGAGFTTLLAPYVLSSTLGTMSTQNATAVAITGGAINGATVGTTTAANGTFTNLVVNTTISATPSGTIALTAGILGSINNIAIGGVTPQAGAFTTLSASGTVSGAGFTTLLSTYAKIDSQAFTGTPSLPTGTTGITQAAADNTTKLATTAFVKSQSYLTANQTITLSGDVTGSGAAAITATVAQFQGRPFASTLPTTGQVIGWNGTTWLPQTNTATPGGTTGQIQYNNSGVLGGIAQNGTGNVVMTTNAAGVVFQNALGVTGAAATDATLTLNKPVATQNNVLYGQKGALNRWGVIPGNSTAEGGSNAGSDFFINSYNDAGAFLASPLSITRSNSQANFAGNVVVSGGVFVLQGANVTSYMAKTASGQAATLYGQMGASNRWALQLGSAVAESGSNAGSDFVLTRFSDASAYLGDPISCIRSTGIVTFASPIVNGSDAALKENVETISDALAKVLALDGVTFNQIGSERRDMGLIAQEVQTVVPEVVFEVPTPEKFNGLSLALGKDTALLGLSYPNLVALLINAVKELNAKVEALEARP